MDDFSDILAQMDQAASASPAQTPPIGRITSYGYAADPTGDSASLGRGRFAYPTGAFDNPLRPSSIAVSRDVEQYLRQQGIQPMQPVSMVMDDGTTQDATWDDRTARAYRGQALTGRVDVYSPSGPSPMNDRRVVRIERAQPAAAHSPTPSPTAQPRAEPNFDDILAQLPAVPAQSATAIQPASAPTQEAKAEPSFDDILAQLPPVTGKAANAPQTAAEQPTTTEPTPQPNLTPMQKAGGTLMGAAGVQRAKDAQELGDLSAEHYQPNFPAAGVDLNAPRQKDAFEKYLQPVGDFAETVNSITGRRVGSTAGGIGGIILGNALASNPYTAIGYPLILGYLGSRTGGAVQEGANQAFETPEQTQARHEFTAYEESQHPYLAKAIDLGTSLPFFRPSPSGLMAAARGAGYLRAGLPLPALEKAALANTAGAAGIGAGQHVATSAFEGRTPTLEDTAESAAEMALMNKTTGLGRYIGLPSHSEEVQPPEAQPHPEPAAQEATPQTPEPVPTDTPPPPPPPTSPETPQETTPPEPVNAGQPEQQPSQNSGVGAGERPPAEPAPSPQPAPPQKFRAAAVRTPDGTVYEGSWHGAALDKVPEKLWPYTEVGFTTQEGQFVRTKLGESTESLAGTDRMDESYRSGLEPAEGDRALTKQLEGKTGQSAETLERIKQASLSEAPPPPSEPPTSPEPIEGEQPPEPAPEVLPIRVTSIKNAQTDIDRIAMALRPAGEPIRRPWSQVEAGAREKAPETDTLVSELDGKAREVSDTESAQLAIKWTQEQDQLDRLNQAVIDGDANAPELRAQQLDKLQKLADVLQQVGTKAGQSLAARKMFDVSQWDLGRMIRNARAARGGSELTPEELHSVNEIHAGIKKAEELLSQRAVKRAEGQSASMAQEKFKQHATELAKEPPPKAEKPALKKIREFLDAQEAEAERQIEEHRKQGGSFTSGGLGKLPMAKQYLTIAAARLARGGVKAAELTTEFVKRFGEGIREHMPEIIKQARKNVLGMMRNAQTPEDIIGKMAARLKEGTHQMSDMGAYVQELGKALVRSGVDKFEDFIPALTAELQKVKPDITPREAQDLYGGYGKTTRPPQEPVEVASRRLRAESQKQSQIDDLERGIQALRSGPQSDKVADEVRAKLQKVKELLRDAPKATDPETQLRSGLDAQETRLKNELRDAAEKYDLAMRGVEDTSKPGSLPEDPRNAQLKATLDRVRKSLAEIRKIKGLSDDQKADAAVKFMDREIERITRDMQKDVFRREKGTAREKRADELVKIAQLKALRAERDEMASLQDEISGKTQADRVKALEDQRDELDRQMQSGNVEAKSTPEKEDAQPIEDLKAEIAAMRAQRDKMRRELTAKTPAQRKAERLAELDERIAALDKDLQAGTTSPKPKTPKVEDVDIEAKKAELTAMQKLRGEIERAKNKPTLDEIEKRQIADLENQISEKEDRLTRGDVAVKPKPSGPPGSVRKAELTRERNRLNDEIARERRAQSLSAKGTPEQRRLAQWKAARSRREASLKQRIAKNDFARRQKPERKFAMDDEARDIENRIGKLKQDFTIGQRRAEEANAPRSHRTLEFFARLARASALSGLSVMGKLTTIAAQTVLAFKPLEQAVGGVYSKLFPKLAAKAAGEGGFSPSVEWHALGETFKKAWGDISGRRSGKFGEMDIDYIHGGKEPHADAWYDIFGKIHAALKSPARRNEFERKFLMRLDAAERDGENPMDPQVHDRIGKEAYDDAQEAILMEDNVFSRMYRRALTALKDKEKGSNYPSLGKKALEVAIRAELPVVRIPTNFVIRTLQHALGTIPGIARVAIAYAKGIENLKPEQAESIMKNLKRGSVGLAFLLYGLYHRNNVGGVYQPGEKKEPGQPEHGDVNVAGITIPHAFLHHPAIEAMQLGATVANTVHAKAQKEGNSWAVAQGIADAFGGLMSESPLTSSLAASHPFTGTVQQSAGRYVQSKIPQAVQQAARYMDRTPRAGPVGAAVDVVSPNAKKRSPKTFYDYLKMGTPGMRDKVSGPKQAKGPAGALVRP